MRGPSSEKSNAPLGSSASSAAQGEGGIGPSGGARYTPDCFSQRSALPTSGPARVLRAARLAFREVLGIARGLLTALGPAPVPRASLPEGPFPPQDTLLQPSHRLPCVSRPR